MSAPAPLLVDGKFLRSGSRRGFLRMVTYGPFPGGWPRDFLPDFRRLRALGCDALRLYQAPTPSLLEAALGCNLTVFAGLRWPCATDFLRHSRTLAEAETLLADGLATWGGHPALAGVFVANEVPSDLARWMGPARVREAIERLIHTGKLLAPDRLFAYGNFPSTESLEPENADFTACNVFLENEAPFRHYLRRLHHLAGDRPVVISEFGLDSRRNGTARQAETLGWAIRAARDEGMAGLAVYAWSDRWWNAGQEVTDWDFGLTDREGHDKPALAAVAAAFAENRQSPPSEPLPSFSVIVCTRDGRQRIGPCLDAIAKLHPPPAETIVIDDGSRDHTDALVRRDYPWVKLLTLPPSGLSAARNTGAAAASGEILAFTDDDCRPDPEWLAHLAARFADPRWSAVGGPNLPPKPLTASEAAVHACPGGPSHVMLDDEHAEHLPGCNLAVRKKDFDEIGGFDPAFTTAGDDVDFCWMLLDSGKRLGFAPLAFVWHHRRATLPAYFLQQWGYGKAEALLVPKHRARFTRRGSARWQGFIYCGGPVRAGHSAVIYHGLLGQAGYQSLLNRGQPLRPVDPRFPHWPTAVLTELATRLQPLLRGLARRWFGLGQARGTAVPGLPPARAPRPPHSTCEFTLWSAAGRGREHLLQELVAAAPWHPAEPDSGWDLAHGDLRLLAATELTDGPGRLTHVRVASLGHSSAHSAAATTRSLAREHGWTG